MYEKPKCISSMSSNLQTQVVVQDTIFCLYLHRYTLHSCSTWHVCMCMYVFVFNSCPAEGVGKPKASLLYNIVWSLSKYIVKQSIEHDNSISLQQDANVLWKSPWKDIQQVNEFTVGSSWKANTVCNEGKIDLWSCGFFLFFIFLFIYLCTVLHSMYTLCVLARGTEWLPLVEKNTLKLHLPSSHTHRNRLT